MAKQEVPFFTFEDNGREVNVYSSPRRVKYTNARTQGFNRIAVRVPGWMSRSEAEVAARSVLESLNKKITPSYRGDEELQRLAHTLNETYLDGTATVGTIRWVGNMKKRWGSCTSISGDIRLNDTLKLMPDEVVEVVLLHELAHTLVSNHNEEFFSYADRHPKAEWAKGFLSGWSQHQRSLID